MAGIGHDPQIWPQARPYITASRTASSCVKGNIVSQQLLPDVLQFAKHHQISSTRKNELVTGLRAKLLPDQPAPRTQLLAFVRREL